MNSTTHSGGTGAGRGGGDKGADSQQSSNLKRPRLHDVISTKVVNQIVPYVSHQLNAALYEQEDSSTPEVDRYAVKVIFTRNQLERPGALAVTVGEGTWGADNPTTSTLLSRCPPWPVTTYAQLEYVLGFTSHWGSYHLLMLWVGARDKSLPAVLHRSEDESLESFVYNSLSGVSFFKISSWEDGDYTTHVAKIVWDMVGEAPVPPTTTRGAT